MEWEGSGAWVNFLVKVVCVCFWLQGRKSSDFLQQKREGFFLGTTVRSQISNAGNVAQPCKNLLIDSEAVPVPQ